MLQPPPPPRTKTYLNSGLRSWYVLKHNANQSQLKPKFMKAHADFVAMNITRVAVQLGALAVFMMGFGAMALVQGPVRDYMHGQAGTGGSSGGPT